MDSDNRDNFSKRNFENLVYYYSKELRKILLGISVSDVLSNSERATLLRSGVIFKSGSGSRVHWMVSRKALNYLEKMKCS
jgi:hypothetical protein